MTISLPKSGIEIDIDFDPAPMRARYVDERSKRLRDDNLGQFQGIADLREIYDVDPYSEPIERAAVQEDCDVVILGGGFGGLLAGAYLTKQGVRDFRIVEQGGDFGGTWYWNRYPGVQCDVESYIYLPLLEETGFVPSQRYADGDEIFEHAQRIGRHFDLYRAALFQTSATAVTWSERTQRWEVRTNRGDMLRARFVVRANGPLNKPQFPRVAGIADFKGAMFHTSRWDYGYTGGDQHGGMSNLRDKRVAIIGTGATGVQAIPFLADDAAELFVIQRTPSVVGPRDNRPTDPAWAASLEPGWQQRRHRNFNSLVNGHPQDENLVGDIWTTIMSSITGQHLVETPLNALEVEDQMVLAEVADMQLMRGVHERIDSIVEDPDTAEALKPWFGAVCKRPTFNDEYLQSFNNPSVHLVASPKGVERFTETGLVVDGTHYDVDCIIFATGFETGSATADRYGYDIVGRGGRSMREVFADGAKTLHGFFSVGFPNFVELGVSQNAYVVNFTFMLDRKARHAARVIAHALDRSVAAMEPEEAAQAEWVQRTRESFLARMFYLSTCTPGYYNGQGDLERGFWNDVYQGSEVEFWDMIDKWWEDQEFEGLRLQSAGLQVQQ
ncbi:putative flavoprotein involved in K+ transport [Mycolicibacterium flavescens]|uniref:flavin-containing monooxygenase n=1 Tax=Mycobacterium neumannii TaxID=2048551 RepID=UPI000B94564D|nr:NAD(P)/FAD-dependent oxidoreductase [Mycobacterium neumannii]VEG47120.1 putative flavoprotein involved in K+ transport [Mycolicibacterium flavescens]